MSPVNFLRRDWRRLLSFLMSVGLLGSVASTQSADAREPMLVEMAGLCNGEIIYFNLDSDLSIIKEHCLHGTAGTNGIRGKRAVTVRDGEIFLINGSSELPLSKLNDVPITCDGQAVSEVENVLAAVAAAWSLGIDPTIIRSGIGSFHAFSKA